uniref:Uncharacterized protein n=1 Tax=Arundo donax TaxID=35708 RepID=A0A0A8Z8Y4_ARUDO
MFSSGTGSVPHKCGKTHTF